MAYDVPQAADPFDAALLTMLRPGANFRQKRLLTDGRLEEVANEMRDRRRRFQRVQTYFWTGWVLLPVILQGFISLPSAAFPTSGTMGWYWIAMIHIPMLVNWRVNQAAAEAIDAIWRIHHSRATVKEAVESSFQALFS